MDHTYCFQRKVYGLNGFDNFFSHFLLNFWISRVFVVVFLVNDLL